MWPPALHLSVQIPGAGIGSHALCALLIAFHTRLRAVRRQLRLYCFA